MCLSNLKGMTLEKTKQILQSIQLSIQQKDEDMVWADSCCLQLVTKQGQMYTFQTENPLVKKDWITELRLAQLALDPNNSPSWEVPEQEQRPSTKMPLFVSSQQVYHSQHQTEVRQLIVNIYTNIFIPSQRISYFISVLRNLFSPSAYLSPSQN